MGCFSGNPAAARAQVWKIKSGQCLRKFDSAHAQGVTALAFSRDGTHVLSASYDGLARVHGLKSGKMLKEFRGHTSYVNCALYSPDGAQVAPAGSMPACPACPAGLARKWHTCIIT